MLIVFKAEGAADVMMFGEVAMKMIALMGKPPSERGVVTVEQLPDAIERLKLAVARDKAGPKPAPPEDQEKDGEVPVGLTQRVLPLIELLEHARREEAPVLWGV